MHDDKLFKALARSTAELSNKYLSNSDTPMIDMVDVLLRVAFSLATMAVPDCIGVSALKSDDNGNYNVRIHTPRDKDQAQ